MKPLLNFLTSLFLYYLFLFFQCPPFSETSERSPQKVFLSPKSAIFLCLPQKMTQLQSLLLFSLLLCSPLIIKGDGICYQVVTVTEKYASGVYCSAVNATCRGDAPGLFFFRFFVYFVLFIFCQSVSFPSLRDGLFL